MLSFCYNNIFLSNGAPIKMINREVGWSDHASRDFASSGPIFESENVFRENS